MRVKITYRCGCGIQNINRGDWYCHFKYGGFWKAILYLLLTRFEFERVRKPNRMLEWRDRYKES